MQFPHARTQRTGFEAQNNGSAMGTFYSPALLLEDHVTVRSIVGARGSEAAPAPFSAAALPADYTKAVGNVGVETLKEFVRAGGSLVLLNLLAARSSKRVPRSALLAGFAVLAGLATAWLRPYIPGALPEAIAGYIVQWPSADNKPVVALFPLLPWVGFACMGALCGLGWSRAADSSALELQLIVTVALGAFLALLTSESWTPAYLLARAHAWLGPLLRLGYKIGLVCVLMGVALAITRAKAAAFAPLLTLGRASLLVYWVHLEFAFGVVAKPIVRALDLPGWALGTFLLWVAMWAMAAARLHINLDALRGLRRGTATS